MNLPNYKELFIDVIQMKELYIDGVRVWKGITNQVPISTDTDGSIFNGIGYKDNARLSSSGSVSGSAQNGSVTTGFIPFPNPDGTQGDRNIIRMKGVEWLNASSKYSGHYYILFYDANKKILTQGNYLASADYSRFSHVVTITRGANGVETVVFNKDYGTGNAWLQAIRNQAKYVRITAYGKGADMIVTINEEI